MALVSLATGEILYDSATYDAENGWLTPAQAGGSMDVGFASITFDFTKLYQVDVTVTADGSYSSPSVWVYSYTGDANASNWWTLGKANFSDSFSGVVSLILGSTSPSFATNWAKAEQDGESHLIVEAQGCRVEKIDYYEVERVDYAYDFLERPDPGNGNWLNGGAMVTPEAAGATALSDADPTTYVALPAASNATAAVLVAGDFRNLDLGFCRVEIDAEGEGWLQWGISIDNPDGEHPASYLSFGYTMGTTDQNPGDSTTKGGVAVSGTRNYVQEITSDFVYFHPEWWSVDTLINKAVEADHPVYGGVNAVFKSSAQVNVTRFQLIVYTYAPVLMNIEGQVGPTMAMFYDSSSDL